MMTSISPVTLTSISHTSGLHDSDTDSYAITSFQSDFLYSEIFDFVAYSVDTGSIDWDADMNMPLEVFCPEIEFFDNDVRPAKASSPATTSLPRALTYDSNMGQASGSLVAVSSLSVPVIHRSEPLPSNLQPSISGVITERGGESQPPASPSETSGVTDDGFLESEPREADEPTMTISTQHSSSSLFIDLTEEDNEKSISDEPESPEADKSTPTTPTQHSSSSSFIDLIKEDNEQSASDKPEFPEADKPTPTILTQHSLSSSFIDLTKEGNKQSIVLQETQKIDNLYLSNSSSNSNTLQSKKRKYSGKNSPAKSQYNTLLAGRRTRPKTSFEGYLDYMSTPFEKFERLLEQSNKEMDLDIIKKQVKRGLRELKDDVLAWNYYDEI